MAVEVDEFYNCLYFKPFLMQYYVTCTVSGLENCNLDFSDSLLFLRVMQTFITIFLTQSCGGLKSSQFLM